MRGFANIRNPTNERFDCVLALRDWFRRILRRNKDKKLNVTACDDPVLLGLLVGKKTVLPDPEPIIARLRAIHYSLDDDFPELESPRSVSSTPLATPRKLAKSYAAVVSTPSSVEAGPSSAPVPLGLKSTEAPRAESQVEESSSLPEDSSRDPLILKIFNMMTSWDERITKLEKRDEAQTDGKEKVTSPPRQSEEAVQLVEQTFSPQQSPRSSPFKGIN